MPITKHVNMTCCKNRIIHTAIERKGFASGLAQTFRLAVCVAIRPFARLFHCQSLCLTVDCSFFQKVLRYFLEALFFSAKFFIFVWAFGVRLSWRSVATTLVSKTSARHNLKLWFFSGDFYFLFISRQAHVRVVF